MNDARKSQENGVLPKEPYQFTFTRLHDCVVRAMCKHTKTSNTQFGKKSERQKNDRNQENSKDNMTCSMFSRDWIVITFTIWIVHFGSCCFFRWSWNVIVYKNLFYLYSRFVWPHNQNKGEKKILESFAFPFKCQQ